MFYITDTQKKVLSLWAILGVIILLLVILIAVTTKKTKEQNINSITADNSNRIIDRNRYYTVKNAITKYYSYINMKDYDSVLKILDGDYIKDNNIDVNNVSEYLTDTDISLSYQSKVMCLKDVDKSIYKFVVEGEEIGANTGKVIGKKYYEIALDGEHFIFSLKPIDNDYYNEVCNEIG